jgi:hypothetical protein
MERSKLVWLGFFIGSTVGDFVPSLWGASSFSISGVFTSAIGGLLGIWLFWKIGE